ncbi:hypothetical protein V8G54_001075 [Vigna mungo]|uniref:Uncharacterized protein n=1 Tax=Vigna mungo TaxID=3915 RepID=A0AAQ3SB53_VIGMU
MQNQTSFLAQSLPPQMVESCNVVRERSRSMVLLTEGCKGKLPSKTHVCTHGKERQGSFHNGPQIDLSFELVYIGDSTRSLVLSRDVRKATIKEANIESFVFKTPDRRML